MGGGGGFSVMGGGAGISVKGGGAGISEIGVSGVMKPGAGGGGIPSKSGIGGAGGRVAGAGMGGGGGNSAPLGIGGGGGVELLSSSDMLRTTVSCLTLQLPLTYALVQFDTNVVGALLRHRFSPLLEY